MTGLVFACIAPHGSELIAELAGENLQRTAATRGAMEELGRRMEQARPETVVIITPHGVRVTGAVCVMTTERAIGTLEGEDGAGHVDIDMAVDTELGLRIAVVDLKLSVHKSACAAEIAAIKKGCVEIGASKIGFTYVTAPKRATG